MIKLLLKIFIKNYDDVKNTEVRTQYGMLAGIVGIVCNLLLFALKLLAGIITASVSIMADAVNNLSDAGSSVVTLVGFKMAGKPADMEHPYGHGRIEYIAGFIVSGAIILMGVELFTSSFNKIIHPTALNMSVMSIVILVVSIFVKLWMASYNRYLGKRVDSAAMKATATDSLSDCLSTGVVLAGLIFTFATNINIDGYAGALVAIVVIIAGVGAAKDTISPLLGQPPSKEFVDELTKMVMDDEHIIGVHDIMVHDYGPGRIYVSLHAEIPYTMDVMEAHDAIDMTESRIAKELNCFITIHMDPVVTDDKIVNELKNMTIEAVKEVGEELTIHDFRTVSGPQITNLIFDVVVPYGFGLSDAEVKEQIQEKITAKRKNCFTVIHIDKSYIG